MKHDPIARLLLGVIGHVDHGKTALVRALTGVETDRLVEEKRRGISIALGFAPLALDGAPDGAVVDLVDMPGHERFVRTMVSGATGVNGVLLVVAANEGIQPQTVEHVDIAGLLGIRRAIVVVTKTDLVGATQAEAAGQAAVALAEAAGLRAAAAVLTSVATGAGLDALRAAIAAALAATAPPDDDGFAYLPVDRAFSIAGHGAVVTGTLRRGGVAVGDVLALTPGGPEIRVRGLQVHGAAVSKAAPGKRVAVNVRGAGLDELGRGTALCTPDLLTPASWLSVQLRAVAGAPALANGTLLRLLFGTTEVEARLRLLDRDLLAPGETALAQLHCREPVAIPAREAFILRLPSPPQTIAGGLVLDPDTVRQRRRAPGALARLTRLAGASPASLVVAEVVAAGPAGITLASLARLAGVAPARAAAFLTGQPVVLGRSGVAVAAGALRGVMDRLPALLEPHTEGVSREALLRLLPGVGAAVLDEAVARLVAAGAAWQDRGKLRLRQVAREHAAAQDDAAAASRIAEQLRRGGLTPPDAASLTPDVRARRLLDRLVREGVVIRARDQVQKRDILFHQDAVEAARQRLRPLLAAPGLLVKEAGEALGISRKFSVPLLEHLDAIHFTRRVADRRVLAQRD